MVGFATRELVRRKSSNPGTWRSLSSSEIPAAWRNCWVVRMRVLAGLSPDASGDRYAVTVTLSRGCSSSTWTGEGPSRSTDVGAKWGAVICTRPDPAGTVKLPSAAVVR